MDSGFEDSVESNAARRLGMSMSSSILRKYSTKTSTCNVHRPRRRFRVLSIPPFLRLYLFLRIYLHRRPKPSNTLHHRFPRVCLRCRLPRCRNRPPCQSRALQRLQTKNAVRNAQTLDFNKKRLLDMHYMLKVPEETCERGLKGILDAIGSYS